MFQADATLSNELLLIITEIDEFKGKWEALKQLTPERLTKLQKVATIESVASSTRIEGVTLSDAEVATIISNLKQQSFESRDEQEVAGYAQAMELVFESFDEMVLNENNIKYLHKLLLSHSTKDQRHMGEYKKLSNSVAAFDSTGKQIGIVFETSTPFETPQKMFDLVGWAYNELKEKTQHPLIIIAIFIVTFLAIHPFQDGNGRLSRVITTWLLLKAGYSYTPYSSMENIIESNKDLYYKSLRKTQKTIYTEQTDWNPWLFFFLKTMISQKDKLEKKIEKEKLLRTSLPQNTIEIIQLIKEHGELNISQLAELTQINRNTLKIKLNELVKKQFIKRHGKARATRYSAF